MRGKKDSVREASEVEYLSTVETCCNAEGTSKRRKM